jgi:formylglycine-generating enzyme required for sulfatase activity
MKISTFEAVIYGTDKFGQWSEFAVNGTDGIPITQRLRWIHPGSFLMGSPPDEHRRFYDEGPQHEVRISKGFWLFDTPVTQALWVAVMSKNPSRFKGPKRPVENVSWDDAEQFLQKINGLAPGLDLVLPTEAQWEYACRAGTATPNYAGGSGNLEDIAWFSSNSNSQTQTVATKRCNHWGLYDMLGNVWEWCLDDVRKYSADAVTDPVGDMGGAERALRGGSWYNYARCVRAARRHASDRDYRGNSIGFRCARVRP